VLSDLFCEENRIWRKFELVIAKKEQGRYLK